MHVFTFSKCFRVDPNAHFPMWTSLCVQTEQASTPKAEFGSKKENV